MLVLCFVNFQGGKELHLVTVEKVANRKTRFVFSCEPGYGKVSGFELNEVSIEILIVCFYDMEAGFN